VVQQLNPFHHSTIQKDFPTPGLCIESFFATPADFLSASKMSASCPGELFPKPHRHKLILHSTSGSSAHFMGFLPLHRRCDSICNSLRTHNSRTPRTSSQIQEGILLGHRGVRTCPNRQLYLSNNQHQESQQSRAICCLVCADSSASPSHLEDLQLTGCKVAPLFTNAFAYMVVSVEYQLFLFLLSHVQNFQIQSMSEISRNCLFAHFLIPPLRRWEG
jgi:hypothetical protein